MPNSNEYMRNYMANRRTERRDKLIEMAGGACVRCGSTDNLEFNHKDRNLKSFGLAGADLDKSWKTILEEFEKCELLCASHHMEYTKSQWTTAQILPWNKDIHGEYKHGSARMYHKGCRCDRCKRAKVEYRNGRCGNGDVVA